MAQAVFMIHDAADKPFARQMAVALSLAGAIVWLDEAEIGNADEMLIKQVYKAISHHVFLAVVLSPNSAESEWLRRRILYLLKQQVPGFHVTLLPLLIKKCSIPDYMMDQRIADFRNPEGFQIMAQKVIRFLELEQAENGPLLASNLSGVWQGSWDWCGRHRSADLFLSSWPESPSRMIIHYLKSGVLSIVEEELEVKASDNSLKLIGIHYRMLERGISKGWILDSFTLSVGESGTTLEGIFTDKKGIQSKLVFQRI